MDSADILLFNEQLDHIAMLLQYILYAICVFIVLRIISWWIAVYARVEDNVSNAKQKKLLDEILKELKEKNKE
jgi:hypothetical protein